MPELARKGEWRRDAPPLTFLVCKAYIIAMLYDSLEWNPPISLILCLQIIPYP